MDGGQLFFLNEGKGPNEWPAYFYKHLFYLEVVAVLILIHHCNALSGVIVGTEQDEKIPILFHIGSGCYSVNRYKPLQNQLLRKPLQTVTNHLLHKPLRTVTISV